MRKCSNVGLVEGAQNMVIFQNLGGSNMPFCAWVCPYTYAYALVKTIL